MYQKLELHPASLSLDSVLTLDDLRELTFGDITHSTGKGKDASAFPLWRYLPLLARGSGGAKSVFIQATLKYFKELEYVPLKGWFFRTEGFPINFVETHSNRLGLARPVNGVTWGMSRTNDSTSKETKLPAGLSCLIEHLHNVLPRDDFFLVLRSIRVIKKCPYLMRTVKVVTEKYHREDHSYQEL